ncbi:Syh1 protein [Saccharomycopsis crataegensis]|uniref:Syh1 protein n=1 Tax=Saccharomycopsis crataegensis TaxID=43959 RepID=A0AAV5QL16_9ASCO|nr:Syh1 protein [Saccharomycopsis crataegensis]
MSQSAASLSFGPTWMRPKSSLHDEKISSLSATNSQKVDPSFDVKDALASSKIISPNSASTRYSLNEMFDVLDEMKEKGDLIPQNSDEPYKNPKPMDILHVVLNENGKIQGSSSSVTNLEHSIDNLSLGKADGTHHAGISNNNSWSNPEPQQPSTTSTTTQDSSVLSNVSSPAAPAGSLLDRIGSKKSLLDSLNSPSHVPPPPGFFNISPENISWYYLDPSNQEQGPFNGPMMQNWFSQGYLKLDLQIRRSEETAYYPLNQLMARVQNSYQPFLVPLPSVNHQPYPLHAHPGGGAPQSAFFGSGTATPTNTGGSNFFQTQDTSGGFNSNGWGNSQRSNLMQPTWSTRPIGSQDFALSDTIPSRLATQSPLYNNPLSVTNSFTSIQPTQTVTNPLSVENTGGSSLLASSNTFMSSTNSPLVNAATTFETEPKQSLDQDHISSLLLGSVLKEEVPTDVVGKTSKKPVEETPEEMIPTGEPVKKVTEKPKKESAKKTKKGSTASKETNSEHQPTTTTTTTTTIAVAETPTATIESFIATTESSSTKKVTETVIVEKSVQASKPKLAPWASKPAGEPATKKQLTLKEIQELEAAERAREQKLIEQKKITQRNILFSEALKHETTEKKSTLPGTAGWASIGSQSKLSAPAKTLFDIQKEEAAKKRAATIAKASSVIASVEKTTVSNDNSWTVVATAAKKQQAPSAASATGAALKTQYKVSGASSSKLQTPTQLRNVSSTVHQSSTVSSSASSTNSGANSAANKQRREFLSWCRGELHDLNRGVNKEELLRMFFQFPCSNDSRDLIQDTIYSSSKTLNGRRFAEEFIKRRKGVEKHVVNWDDALNMDPDDEEEDEWIVTSSKKKGRR